MKSDLPVWLFLFLQKGNEINKTFCTKPRNKSENFSLYITVQGFGMSHQMQKVLCYPSGYWWAGPRGSQAIFIMPFLDKIIFLLTDGVERMQGLDLCVQWEDMGWNERINVK